MSDEAATPRTFAELGISPQILEALTKKGITNPTPIQHAAIPAALDGQDVMGIAQTGTGKTFAFGLPFLQRLSQNKGRALVIVPTRELAQQVEDSLAFVASVLRINTAVFVGGASMERQRAMLKRDPRVLIATPGRLIDHLERRSITLREVNVLVFDEADRMFDMGFAPQIARILKEVPAERQTMLFSATMPKEILQVVTHHMRMPVHIEIAPQGTSAERVEQAILIMHREEKPSMLEKLLKDYSGTVLVFIRTKHGAKKLTTQLIKNGHKAAEIHANRSLAQRKEALAGFKSGRYRVLVATDIAARGIDVNDIEVVVNYDLPDNIDEYVHRVGRTGRAGKTGQAVSFATPDQRDDIRRIERLIRMPLTIAELPSASMPGASGAPTKQRHRPHRAAASRPSGQKSTWRRR